MGGERYGWSLRVGEVTGVEPVPLVPQTRVLTAGPHLPRRCVSQPSRALLDSTREGAGGDNMHAPAVAKGTPLPGMNSVCPHPSPPPLRTGEGRARPPVATGGP